MRFNLKKYLAEYEIRFTILGTQRTRVSFRHCEVMNECIGYQKMRVLRTRLLSVIAQFSFDDYTIRHVTLMMILFHVLSTLIDIRLIHNDFC